MRLALPFLFALAVASGCSHGSPPPPQPTPQGYDIQGNRRAVYEAVLKELFVKPGATKLVIDPNVEKGNGTIPQDLRLDVPIVWFSEADWNSLAVIGGDSGDESTIDGRWMQFHSRYGGVPWLRFSEVVFDGATRATVEAGSTYASLSGSGTHVVLEKGADGWHVVKSSQTWVS
jgi:hypothetical protein